MYEIISFHTRFFENPFDTGLKYARVPFIAKDAEIVHIAVPKKLYKLVNLSNFKSPQVGKRALDVC